MGKTKNQSKDGEATKSESSSKIHKKRRRREVQVVKCSGDFPISSKPPRTGKRAPTEGIQQPGSSYEGDVQTQNLDWNDTAHEIRSLGATAFVGQQKRKFQDEQYEKLTGRKQKKQHVPFPIQMGIRKKAAQRLERQMAEAKASGMVLPKSMTSKSNNKKREDSSRTSRIHGPAPSVGFMNKGVLKVKKPSR